IAADGLVIAKVVGNIGTVVEVNSETDFVAKNQGFVDFVNNCADVIIRENPADVAALLEVNDGGSTIQEQLHEKILTIGENLTVRRFTRLEGTLVSYVHAGGKIGVMVEFDTDCGDKPEFMEYGKDVAMQVAALNPLYLDKSDVPSDVVEKEREILIAQVKIDPKTANKPQEVLEKMVEGKLNKKFYQDSCLVEQAFVKDGAITVGKHTEAVAKELGGKISIKSFVRYEKGEGIEKRVDDFASEVAGMVK
ncbi:MAG: translation elongation factor Ts, partial [Oscillospiraceae bacterium]